MLVKPRLTRDLGHRDLGYSRPCQPLRECSICAICHRHGLRKVCTAPGRIVVRVKTKLTTVSMVWGFANITISTNLARDLGTRIVAAIFFGREAFSYKNYSWIAILVNIPATFLATAYYEFLMRDSLQKIGHGHAIHAEGEDGLARHLSRTGMMEQGTTNIATKNSSSMA
jgi:hypothetical protein